MNCPDPRCVLPERHHGPHQDDATPLSSTWWNVLNGWPGHHPGGCTQCGAIEDAEIARLTAGGELRPNQVQPKWLRERRPPPRRLSRGATMVCGGRGLRIVGGRAA